VARYALDARGGSCSKDGVTIRHGDQVMVSRFHEVLLVSTYTVAGGSQKQ
jgi:hypothetical protein